MIGPRSPFRSPGLFRLCLLGFERRVLHLGDRSVIDGHDLPGRRHADVDLGPRDRLQGPSVPVAHPQPLPEHREGTAAVEPSFVSDGKVETDLLRRRGGGEERGLHVRLRGEPAAGIGREFGEVRVGGGDGLHAPDRQLGDKPRLKGPPKPSYPSLRPRGRRGDDRDPEPPAASGEPGAGVPVGGFVPPGRLPVFEDRPAVGAEGLRDAVFPQDLPQRPAMPGERFPVVEAEPHDGAAASSIPPRGVAFGKPDPNQGWRLASIWTGSPKPFLLGLVGWAFSFLAFLCLFGEDIPVEVRIRCIAL